MTDDFIQYQVEKEIANVVTERLRDRTGRQGSSEFDQKTLDRVIDFHLKDGNMKEAVRIACLSGQPVRGITLCVNADMPYHAAELARKCGMYDRALPLYDTAEEKYHMECNPVMVQKCWDGRLAALGALEEQDKLQE